MSPKNKIEKVMLINPYNYYSKEVNEPTHYPPLGLAYAASYLESKGIKCSILDANLFRLNFEDVIQKVKENNPDLVGITANIAFIKEAEEISRECKENLGKYVLIGGPSSKGDTKNILERSKADAVVRGEGEIVIWNLIDSINRGKDTSKIPGTSFIKKNKLTFNTEPEPIKDVDNIPFPAYHLLPDLDLYHSRSRKHPVAPILTSRGCPYQCTFCLSQNTGWRPRSAENVIKEIDLLVTKFGVKQIDILDDNFTLEFNRAIKILDTIIEKNWGISIQFPNGVRADRLSEEIVHKMKLAGVYKVGVGIESGDQNVLNKAKKGLKIEQSRKAVSLFRKEGIVVFGFFMFGLLDETKETMLKTIDFAKEINPHYANFGVVTPLPGTTLYQELQEKKILDHMDEGIKTGYYSIKGGHFETEKLKKEEVELFVKKAYREFYFRPSKIWDMMKTIKTYRELKWTIETSLPLLKGMLKNTIKMS